MSKIKMGNQIGSLCVDFGIFFFVKKCQYE